MQKTWVRFLGRKDPLEEEMATQSSILAWRIPWTEEPGRLQSMRSQRVRHRWATNTFTFIYQYIINVYTYMLYKYIIVYRCIPGHPKHSMTLVWGSPNLWVLGEPGAIWGSEESAWTVSWPLGFSTPLLVKPSKFMKLNLSDLLLPQIRRGPGKSEETLLAGDSCL